MAEELLSLKWNNHQSHFVDILTYLREKDMFIDATIACGGKVYSAHKFVLSTCSDYFKQIFTRNTSNNPIVFMKDVSSRDIEALLDFMYHGEVNVPQSSLGSLIKTAEGLQIKGLAVPDDPPSSRRDQERDKRERDHSSYLESPPPKRRVRDRALSPSRRHNTSSSNNVSHSNSRTNRTSSPLDSSSRTGEDKSSNVNSNSDHHQSSTNSEKAVNNSSSSKSGSNSVKHSIDEDDRGGGSKGSVSGRGEPEAGEIGEGEGTHDDHNDTEDSMDNNSNAGPSSMVATTHSKTEEMEIKQEDVVELAEDDDDDGGAGDWLSGDHGAGSHDGGLGSDNFPDMLMPHSGDMGGGGMGGSSSSGNPSDSAMDLWHQTLQRGGEAAAAGGRREGRHHHRVEGRAAQESLEEQHSSTLASLASMVHDDSSTSTTTHNTTSSSTAANFSLMQALTGVNVRSTFWPSSVSVGTAEGGAGAMPHSSASLDPLACLLDPESHGQSYQQRRQSTGPTSSRSEDGYECEVCGKRFGIRYYYMRHMMSHQEKQYQCPYCHIKVSYKWNLKAHVNNKHRDKPPLY